MGQGKGKKERDEEKFIGADLRDRTFDGQILRGLNFSGANLRGANLSEVTAMGCRFCDADLVDVCMAESRFVDCDFSHARFGATMIHGAEFIGCRFAGSSALLLSWGDAADLNSLVYESIHGVTIGFNKVPVVIMGLGTIIVLIGDIFLADDTIIESHSKIYDFFPVIRKFQETDEYCQKV
jgi:hypothetical protein